MARHNGKSAAPHVVLFVEGDTDEVFFKTLVDYYQLHSQTPLTPCSIYNLKGVTRYTSKLIAKLKNDVMPDADRRGFKIRTVCCSYDTDVFEKANPLIVDWKAIEKSVRRLGVEKLIRIGVKSSIEDWILDDMEGICSFLKIKTVPTSLKGDDGFARLSDLYSKARRTYQKGYVTKELISALDMGKIIKTRSDALILLEEELGVKL